MRKRSGLVVVLSFLVILSGLLAGGWLFLVFRHKNIVTPEGQTAYLLIPHGADFEQVMDSLTVNGFLKFEDTFRWAARYENLPSHVHPGRYGLDPNMNNQTLARKLAMGWQDPLNITLSGTIRTFERLASVLTKNIELDSSAVMEYLKNDSLIAKFGFDSVSLRGMFIPNTYQVYWTVSAEQLMERMYREYKHFWNEERRGKAQDIGLTPFQVSTLASIVYEETKMTDEMPAVAGVYMNRLRINMPLQADPTLIFAARDYSIRRVLKKHTRIDSPYNTYRYRGLPPGPISIPSIEAIDAVLDYDRHHYLYFCAKEDFSGYHNFAATLSGHMKNARRFQKALTQKMKEEGQIP